jgi:hypothetical protein
VITNSSEKPRGVRGEFAPMVPRAVQDACMPYPPALALWIHAQSKPHGWRFDDRNAIARELGWSKWQTRKAIRHLIDVGLYVVVRERNAAGQFATFCVFTVAAVAVTAAASALSSQVTPKADRPSHRAPARKELLRKKHLERIKPAKRTPERADPPALWSPPPPSDRMAVVMGTTGLECEHGHQPGKCGTCRRKANR